MSSSISLPSFRLPSKAKFWKKRRSQDLSDSDPSYRAVYLGNVLTGWAKGDGCMDKPLATLWKNHIGTDKPNIIMKVTVCGSGLKAVTKEHGLTEYWANRITYCAADPAYPKVFCWIYRHEGRKLKQELRCHAVLCPSSSKARFMAERLKERLHQALVDFKKEKVWRQNARLSLANSTNANPSMPYRKMLLSVSGNYRPPLERGKAAPKLKIIEEVITEEDEELNEDDQYDGKCKQEAISNYGEHLKLNERGIDCPKDTSAFRHSEDDSIAEHLYGLPASETYHINIKPNLRQDDDQLSCSTLTDGDININYKRFSSISSDNISVVTTETTVMLEPEMSAQAVPISSNPQAMFVPEGDLVDISKNPRPRPKPKPRTSLGQSSSSPDNHPSSSCNISTSRVYNIQNGLEVDTEQCSSSDGEYEDDEDVVTNYLDKMSITQENRLLPEVRQIRSSSYSSQSPDSHRFSTKSDSSVIGDNDELEDEEETCGSNSKSNEMEVIDSVENGIGIDPKICSSKTDQDTISDESGYSEESNAISTINCPPPSSSTSPAVIIKVIDKNIANGRESNGANIITISDNLSSNVVVDNTNSRNGNVDNDRALYCNQPNGIDRNGTHVNEDDLLNNDILNESVHEDPTVHGVLISDFSTTERLKYLERSRQSSVSRIATVTAPHDFLQNKVPEFCINI